MEESQMDVTVTEDENLALIDIFISNEILEEIFCYLTPIELIRIERVSKRWQEISLKSWRNKKKLSVEHDLGLKFPLEHFEKILLRGGKYLTYLDVHVIIFFPDVTPDGGFTFKSHPYPEETVYKAISLYCRQLESLRMYIDENNTCPSGKNLRFLESSVFQDLKSLEIYVGRRYARESLEKRLSRLLKDANKLEEFKITAECCIDGSCLLSLSKTLKRLSVNCESLDEKIYMKALDNLPNLKHLSIDGQQIDPMVVSKICHKLETFIVGWNDNFFNGNGWMALSLENVKVLDLKENDSVSDAVLRILVEKLPLLEDLSVKSLEKVSDEGFRCLENLKLLKVLNIKDNNQITDDTLTHLGKSLDKLEKVICEKCEGISCSGLLSLIDLCKKLHFLNIGRFDDLTDEFFISALKLVDGKPKNSSLTIDIGASVTEYSECLVPNNDRHLKYNYCKVNGYDILDKDGWAIHVSISRYVSSKSIREEVE